MSSLFFEPATFGQTGDEGSLFFGCFLNQKFGVAIRTFPIDGLIPGCKRTFRKAIAAEEEFAPLGAAFNNFSGTVLLRAADTNGFAAAVGV